jgi:hypothetical protein
LRNVNIAPRLPIASHGAFPARKWLRFSERRLQC